MGFFKKWFNNYIEGRTSRAQYEVAKQLHWSEYRKYPFSYVLDMVKNGRLEQI